MVSTRALLAVIALFQLTTAQTYAQTPAQTKAAAPVSAEPETTTASYGAWVLRCTHRKEGGSEGQICEIDQAVVPQGRQNPIAQIGITRPKGEWHLTAIVPTNITFQNPPKISAEDKDPGVELTWQRCLPGGCIAEGALKEETLRKWRAIAADTGRLFFTDATGRNYAIQFSYRGFAQAIEALSKQHS